MTERGGAGTPLPSAASAPGLGPLLAVALAVAASAWAVFPEVRAGAYSPNDNTFHLVLVARAAEAIEHGQNPFDFWVPEWSFGYPVPRTYQMLGHVACAGVYLALGKSVPLGTLFALFRVLLATALPLAAFASARLLRLGRFEAAAAALLVPLVSSEGLFGVELGSWLWSGYGLFGQAVAAPLFLLSVASGFRAVREGEGVARSALLLALTFLGHFIYGWAAALAVTLAALVSPSEPGRLARLRRLAVVGSLTALETAFVTVSLVSDSGLVNRSRWEPAWKWDSYGALEVWRQLVTGRLLDAGRFPSLTLLALAGVVATLVALRRRTAPPAEVRARTFVLAATAFFLALYAGRPVWGPLLALLGALDRMQLHRLSGPIQLFAVLLAAGGLEALRRRVQGSSLPRLRHATPVLAALVLLPAVLERGRFAAADARLVRETVPKLEAEVPRVRPLLDALRAREGRAFAGLAGTWGRGFRIGGLPAYTFLALERIPAVSYLYHAMALTGDLMVLFDETREAHYRLFGVRSVLAAEGRQLPPFVRPVATVGGVRLLDAPGGGWFEVVSVPWAARVDRSGFFDLNQAWLRTPSVESRQHVLLEMPWSPASALPHLSAGKPLPALAPARDVGTVVHDRRDGEVYVAEVDVTRPSYLLFKMSWHPRWQAVVDRVPVKTVMLSPGFVGIPMSPGRHRVECRYVPEAWKLPLLLAGVLVAAGAFFVERRAGARWRGAAALDTGPTSRPPRRPFPGWPVARLPVPALLALTFGALYAAIGPGNFFSVDEAVVQETAQALVSRRTVDVPAMNTSRAGVGGSFYSFRGPALGFVAAPFAAVGQLLDGRSTSLSGGPAQGPPRGVPEHPLRWGGRWGPFAVLFASAAAGGLAVACLFVVTTGLGGSTAAALTVSLLGGGATLLLSEATHFFQHPLEALALLLALAALTGGQASARRRALVAGLALGIAILTRPNTVPAAVVLAAFGVHRLLRSAVAPEGRRERVVTGTLLLGPGLVAGALYFSYNALRFGSPFLFGYDAPASRFSFDLARAVTVLASYVASPSLSVFLFAPPLVLVALSLRAAWRRWPDVTITLGLVFLSYLAPLAFYASWHGAIAYGPRFLLAPMLLALPLALPLVERALAGHAAARESVVAAALAGAFLALPGAIGDVVLLETRRMAAGRLETFAFVPSLAPPLVLWTELFSARNVNAWLLRALAAPGFALALGAALVAIAALGLAALARRLREAHAARVPTAAGGPSAVDAGGSTESMSGQRLVQRTTFVLAGLVGAGFLAVAPVTESAGPRAFRFLEEGLAAHRAAHPVAASEAYALVLGLQPGNAWALYDMGLLHHQAGRLREAEGLYEAALRSEPGLAPARSNLDLLRRQEAGGAFAERSTALEAVYRPGLALFAAGRVDLALATFREALRLHPAESGLHRDAGLCLYRLGDFAGAAASYRSALALSPTDDGVRTDLAWALLRLGERGEVERIVRDVLSHRPDDAAANALTRELALAASGAPRGR